MRAWFLEITLVWMSVCMFVCVYVCVCVCVCVYVCVRTPISEDLASENKTEAVISQYDWLLSLK